MPKRVAIPRWHEQQLEWLHNYHDRLHDVGLETVDATDASLLAGCDALLLTGGVDVDPSLYKQAPHPMTQASVPGRDALELALLGEALARYLPVLAICRGLQLLNVCLGGSLLQHIEAPGHAAGERSESSWHAVSVNRGSRLYDALQTDTAMVNSRHHQAVTRERLAPGLTVTAMSDDGIVEGVEGTSHSWLVGVQWHPERLEKEAPNFVSDSKKLFETFASVLNDPLKVKRK
jgi:putative glutamine amidotransferase